jgi:hypothetical protein
LKRIVEVRDSFGPLSVAEQVTYDNERDFGSQTVYTVVGLTVKIIENKCRKSEEKCELERTEQKRRREEGSMHKSRQDDRVGVDMSERFESQVKKSRLKTRKDAKRSENNVGRYGENERKRRHKSRVKLNRHRIGRVRDKL